LSKHRAAEWLLIEQKVGQWGTAGATFKNDVLSVTLPKNAEAQHKAKKIEGKAG
jgi:HSP20 family molecular chaperone IbpA